MAVTKIGNADERKEDPLLANGAAKFTADIFLPNMAYVAFLSSPHAHACIKSIDLSKAAAIEGVIDILTGADTKQYNPFPVLMNPAGENGKFPPHPWGFPAGQSILATDKVRHVGEIIAAVAAINEETARKAVRAIEVDYEILPIVLTAREALSSTTAVHETIPDNLCQYVSWGDKQKTEAAIASSEVVIRKNLPYQLVSASPVETRATIADYNRHTEEYTLWTNTQIPHINRAVLCGLVLGIPFNKLNVIVPEIGGSYGCKGYIYNDTAILLLLAKKIKRPVKWVDYREGLYLRTVHARGSDIEATLSGSRDGIISALYCKNYATLGAYSTFNGPGAPAALTGMTVTGAYSIENPFYEVNIAYTNRPMVGPMRGAGRTEAIYVIERLIDLYANEIGMDPIEVRRLNYVKPVQFPYENKLGFNYDSGNYEHVLDEALKIADISSVQKLKSKNSNTNKLIGYGVSSYVAVTGVGPSPYMHNVIGLNGGTYGTAHIRVHQSGDIQLHIGSQPHGQGHITSFTQIVSNELGVDSDCVEIIHSNTSRTLPIGGSYGSRSYQIEGGAVVYACKKIIDKAKMMAAYMLSADETAIQFDSGVFFDPANRTKSLTLKDVANSLYTAWDLPEGLEPGLEAISYWDPDNFAFPFGTHIAVVAIDQDTGIINVLRYVAVDDFGKVCNPGIVNGQTHGNIYMGLSQALIEEIQFNDNGEVVNAFMLDYGSLLASRLPNFEIQTTQTETPHSPHGGKGAGDVAINPVPAALVNAVCNAIGIDHIDMPLTPEKVWKAIQQSNL